MQWQVSVCGIHNPVKGFAVDASIDQCTVGKMICAKFGMTTPTKASHTLSQMTRADSNMGSVACQIHHLHKTSVKAWTKHMTQSPIVAKQWPWQVRRWSYEAFLQ